MKDLHPTAEEILDSALELAENGSWETLHLYQVANAMNISLADIHRYYAQKDDLVDAWFDRADQVMLQSANQKELLKLSSRDRFKRVMLAWLGSLAGHHQVTGDMLLYKLEPAHIHLQVQGVMRISRTVQWMREAVLRDSTHLKRITEEVLDTGIYLSTFIYWLRDTSVGFSKTSHFLDRQLDRAERLRNLMPCC